MSVRAGIVVTGTEVLDGRVRDRNGPWLADRLRELGVDLGYVTIVGDRPQDMERALEFMADQGIDLVLTSGGLGPTADDLTAEVVGRFQGREMVLDEALADRIEMIVRPLLRRWSNIDPEAIRTGTRKQAMVPKGATVLEPVGTAPGLVVAPSVPTGGPTVVVLPGPPRELQPMWSAAIETEALREAIAGATVYEQRTMRLFGIPESEIAETLRQAEGRGIELGKLEVTTCLKRGEIEVVTRYEPDAANVYEAFERLVSSGTRIRCSRPMARRWTCRWRRCCGVTSPDPPAQDDRSGRVVYGRRADVAADGTGGRLGVCEGRRGGVCERREGGARGSRSATDRGARGGVRAGRQSIG